MGKTIKKKMKYLLFVFFVCSYFLLPLYKSEGVLAQEELEGSIYWTRLCRSLTEAKKYQEALAACDHAIALTPKDVTIWIDRGESLLRLEKYLEAVVNYNQVLLLKPYNSLALVKRCQAHLSLQQYQQAISDCQAALGWNLIWEDQTSALPWYLIGEAFSKGEKREEALDSYERAIQVNPNYSLAFVAKCRLLSRLKKYEPALESCHQALEINGDWGHSNSAIAWVNIARINTDQAREAKQSRLYQQSQVFYQQALIAYDRLLAYNPQDAKIWTERGVILGILGRYEQAKASHQWALQIRPNYYLALANKCATLNRLSENQDNPQIAKKGYKEALKACEQAIQEDDGQWEAEVAAYVWNQRGNALIGLGQYQEALTSIERAIVLQPDSAAVWSDRAVALWYLALAVKDINPDITETMWVRKDMETEEIYSRCRLVAASLSQSTGIYPQQSLFNYAFESISCAVALNLASSQAWYNRGRILTSLRDYQSAANAYEWALTGDANLGNLSLLADIWVNQSAVFWHLGRYQHSRDAAGEAIMINPELAEAWYNKGLALMEYKNQDAVEEAVTVYERAIDIEPTNANFWTGKGIALAFLQRYEEALAAVEQALQLNPSHPQAVQNRNQIVELIKTSKMGRW